MDPIDQSKRKPRRTRGTPSFYYRNRFAFALIAAGTVVFTAWTFTPIFRVANEKFSKAINTPSDQELDRRYLFSFGAPRTSRDIQATIDEKKEMHTER